MPHPRTIALLLWAGPAYVVAYFAVVAANLTMGATLFELRATSPLLYGIFLMPLGILLVIAAFGVWFSLRELVGRHMPIGTLRHIPFGQLRLDEILPAAAGLTVACPALLYIVPHVATFPTASQILLVQAPGAFSGWLVAWSVWRMPVSRAMKIFQVLAPMLIALAGLLQVSFAGERLYMTIFARALGLAYFAWLIITPTWLASLMREQPASAKLAESRNS